MEWFILQVIHTGNMDVFQIEEWKKKLEKIIIEWLKENKPNKYYIIGGFDTTYLLTKEVLIKRNLETMLLNSRGLKKETLEIILSLIEDYEDYRTLFDDIMYEGCISGIIPHLIYYSDTEKFFDKYSNEIFNRNNEKWKTNSLL